MALKRLPEHLKHLTVLNGRQIHDEPAKVIHPTLDLTQ